MLGFIQKLFSSESAEVGSDGLEQSQREALIDLLVLAMYSDNHLTLSEDSIIEKQLESLDWDSSETPQFYYEQAIVRARDTGGSDDRLLAISERLGSLEVRERAIKLCALLLDSDGKTTSKETIFLERLNRLFNAE